MSDHVAIGYDVYYMESDDDPSLQARHRRCVDNDDLMDFVLSHRGPLLSIMKVVEASEPLDNITYGIIHQLRRKKR